MEHRRIDCLGEVQRPAARVSRARWLADEVLPHERWLQSKARKWGSSEPEDIVHDTYIRLLQLESVDQLITPSAYAAKAARSAILSQERRRAVISFEPVANDSFDQLASAICVERQMEASSDLRVIARAIEDLPLRTREVLILRRVEGLSLRETAAQLGVSESAVEKHLTKAMRVLRDLIRP